MIQSILGILLVANATSLGWGLRGEWGHWWGATVPGALCGMTLWLAFGSVDNVWQMLIYGSLMGLAMTLGGVLSYGLIVGYSTGEPGRDQRSTSFGLLGLFLVGGLWGFFGGTTLGLLLTEKTYGFGDLATWALLASTGAFLTYKLLVVGLDLHLSPPRSDAWASVLGGALATTAFFGFGHGDMVIITTALVGWLGFGGGFSMGALIHRKGNEAGWNFSSWKFMEHSVGFFGGLALSIFIALRGGGLPEQPFNAPADPIFALISFWFITYMVLSNNIEHWVSDLKWISKRGFVFFHALSLISLPVFIYLVNFLAMGWNAPRGQILVFFAMLLLFTLVGTAKFVDKWSTIRSRVVMTFAIQFALCTAFVILLGI
ncbi:MAG: hypothetical protein HXS50_05695 [Theionarchaea archaeon]|nr:hypothetical protein [Theionarchaea archaeon]